MSERRREYQTRGEAAAAMVQMTAGRRDALTNYFRISVAPRRLVSHNDALCHPAGSGRGSQGNEPKNL